MFDKERALPAQDTTLSNPNRSLSGKAKAPSKLATEQLEASVQPEEASKAG